MKRVYPKEEVCMGCHLCEVHCAVQHSASRDVLKAFTRDSPPPLPRIRVQENGRMFLAVQCRHCPEPLCVYACGDVAEAFDFVQKADRVIPV